MVFLLPSLTPPPPGMVNDHKKYGYFFRHPSLSLGLFGDRGEGGGLAYCRWKDFIENTYFVISLSPSLLFSCFICSIVDLPGRGWRPLKVAFHLQVVLLPHNLYHHLSTFGIINILILMVIMTMQVSGKSQRVSGGCWSAPRDTSGSFRVLGVQKKIRI